jgi:hypothetical protein
LVERYLGVVEAACSSHVAPTKKTAELQGFAALYFLLFISQSRFFYHFSTISTTHPKTTHSFSPLRLVAYQIEHGHIAK